MLEEGDIIIGTVDRIAGTNVFVKFTDNGKEYEGNLVFSEVAPGRIRNIRNYVVPKKKIVCKILKIKENAINLSLRRVTKKEKQEALERQKQEKSYKSILKTILNDKAEKTISEIQKKDNLFEFIENAKQNPEELEKFTGKENSKKILDILNSQKQKKASLKKQLIFHTEHENGLDLIKKILGNTKDIETKYISAGNYFIKTEAEDLKKADNKIKEFIEKLRKENKEIEFKLK